MLLQSGLIYGYQHFLGNEAAILRVEVGDEADIFSETVKPTVVRNTVDVIRL